MMSPQVAHGCVPAALAAAAAEHPYARKLLVCRRMGIGRELLRGLAGRGVGWINFEVTTTRQLAHEIVAADLTAHDLRVADEFDELALLDDAIDDVLGAAEGRLAELAHGTGLRQAVASSVRALRLAGISVAALERTRFRDEDKRAQIARILDDYETRLRRGGLIDTAGLLAQAAAGLSLDGSRLAGAIIYLMPDLPARGLSGVLLRELVTRGATVLPTEPVLGLNPPAGLLDGSAQNGRAAASALSWLHDVGGWAGGGAAESADVLLDVFAATSVTAELREVLRRVMAEGLQWDEVEIIATDAVAYGVALDGLARRLGIPVSYAAGLPVARTRPGRAVTKYLEWVQQGFPADVLRQMLERGDIGALTAEVSGLALSRLLRSLKIGRGRDRYEAALLRRARALSQPQAADDDRSPDEFAEARQRERAELDALSALLRPLLAATPQVPDRLRRDGGSVSPGALAAGVLGMLELVPTGTAVDGTMKARLRTRLERIATTATRETALAGAVAVLMAKLEERVPAPEAEGASPWTSTGGHLHLSDLDHGGHTGRRATFLVGLDAARFPGSGGLDALLVDDDRRRIGGEAADSLPTAAERIEERRYAFAALVARLRGRVTFSYPTWDAVEGRALAPSAELLQAFRLLSGDATADYEALHAAVAPAASAVPRGTALLDADDVWLQALGSGGTLRRGVVTVCGVYPRLEAGVLAWKTRLRSQLPTAHHGFIEPRPALDPRTSGRPVSATELQTLGACPLRYLLRYVLRVKAPDDLELSPEQWLPPIDRGALMHDLFEKALDSAGRDSIPLEDHAFEQTVLRLLDDQIARTRELVPPPGEAVFAREVERLREDARAFVAMVREDGRRFIALERKFGREGADAVSIELPDGSALQLAGAIDRIDQLEDGRLVVIDYKTGSSLRYGGRSGVFEGGRRLQHVLYSAAAERLFEGTVAWAEYQFPSRRAENYRARYERRQMLGDGLAVVTELLDLTRNGWFLPSNTADDCRFCDYAATCRVSVDAYGKVESPPAEWSRESQGPATDALRRVRR